MSKWLDYGFPQITGVPLGTLLEGLYLAGVERARVFGLYNEKGDDRFPNDPFSATSYETFFEKPCPIRHAVIAVEELVENSFRNLTNWNSWKLTPDLREATLENLADYLGEELIFIPDMQRVDSVTYEWISQRYRMLNAVTLAGHFDNMTFRREWYDSGNQESWEEAQKNLKECEALYPSPDIAAAGTFVYDSLTGEPEWFRFQKTCNAPESLTYQLAKGSVLRIFTTPLTSRVFSPDEGGMFPADSAEIIRSEVLNGGVLKQVYRFDSMGFPLTFNQRTLLREYQISWDVKKGDVIRLTGLADDLFASADGSPPQDPGGDRGLCFSHRGVYHDYTVCYDFSQELEFLDSEE